MGVTRVGPRVQSAGTWQHGGSSPSPGTVPPNQGGVSYQKEKPMIELFPGLVDVIIFGGGMAVTALLLIAYAIAKPEITTWRRRK